MSWSGLTVRARCSRRRENASIAWNERPSGNALGIGRAGTSGELSRPSGPNWKCTRTNGEG